MYGFSSEGAGVPEEYVPVGMMLAGIFTEMGILILAWYGSQYLAWVALLFGVLSIVQRVVDRRR